jgi:tetratricopeptide (TPR) repeat protein
VERQAENRLVWNDLGKRYPGLGLPDSAEAAFLKALEINPNSASLRQGLSYCAYSRGDVDSAIEISERLLERSDLASSDRASILSHTAFWPGLALLYAEAGRFKKALELVEKAKAYVSGPNGLAILGFRRNYLLHTGALWHDGDR